MKPYINTKGPCLNCERREVGCHNKCNDYISYKKDVEELREKTNFVKARMYGTSFFSTKKTVTRTIQSNRNYSV